MSFTDPGAIADVSTGSIDPDWGNAIRDRVVNRFANATARDAAITSPKEGMACWLADVDQFLIYNGAAWRQPWNMPWGRVGLGNTTAFQIGIGTSDVDITGAAITWTAVANRRYKVTSMHQFIQRTGQGRPMVRLCTSTNTVLQQMPMFELNVNYVVSIQILYVTTATLAAGSTTWKLRAQTNGSTCDIQQTTTNPGIFLIEDVGPLAGSPA